MLVPIGGTWIVVQTGITAIWFGPPAIVATALLLVNRASRRQDPAR